MKNVVRMLLVVMMLLLIMPATFAQDGCYGLSAEDCTLYADSLDMEDVTSGAFGVVLDFSLTGDSPMDVSATIAGSFSEYEDGSIELLVTLDATATGEEDAKGELRIVDDVVYVSNGKEWKFASLDRLSEVAGVDLESLTSDEGMDSSMGMASAMLPDVFLNYYTVERGEDINGLAVFNANYDLAGLFADPELGPTLMGLVGMIGYEGLGDMSGMTEEEQAQTGQMLGMMLGMVITDPVLNYRLAVDPATGYFNAAELNFGVNVNLGAMTGGEAPPLGVNVALEIALVDLNGSFTYEAPADAVEFTDEELQEMAGSLTSVMGGF